MAEERRQVEVIELQAKVSLPSQEIYDARQKLGFLQEGMRDTGRSAGETHDTFGRLKGELLGLANVFGFALPGSIGLTTLAMTALNIGDKAVQMREWNKAMLASSTVSEEWLRRNSSMVLDLAAAYGILSSEAQEQLLLLGKQRISQEQLADAFDLARLAMYAFGVGSETASDMVGFALVRQGKSFEQARQEFAAWRDVAKEMGVPINEFANALAQLQQQLPAEAKKVKPESLFAFLKEFHEAGLPIFKTIAGASREKRILWERFLGVSEEDIEKAPEQVLSKMLHALDQMTRGIQDSGARKMAMQKLLTDPNLFGISREESELMLDQFEKQINANIPFDRLVQVLPQAFQQKLAQAPEKVPALEEEARIPGKNPLRSFRNWLTDQLQGRFWTELEAMAEPLTQEERERAATLLQQATPEQKEKLAAAMLSARTSLLGIPRLLQLGQDMDVAVVPRSLHQLDLMESIVGRTTGASAAAATFLEGLSTIKPDWEKADIPRTLVTPATKNDEMKIVLELIGNVAEYLEPRLVPAPYDTSGVNIGLELITRKGRSTLTWK